MAKVPKPKITAEEFRKAQADPAFAKELAKKHGLIGSEPPKKAPNPPKEKPPFQRLKTDLPPDYLKKNKPGLRNKLKSGLQKAGAGAAAPMGLLGMAMNAWLIYELGKMAGVFGAEGEQDAAFMGAYEAGITPALQEQQAVASEMMKQRTGTRQMEGMAGFAQRKQDALQTTSTMLDRELDDLLAGKAGLLSKAALMPDTTAQALSHVVNTGLL
tara:strand:+ start:819 stop:1460 length:642 start_codon:yes stop_codon:yes gene_type:complete